MASNARRIALASLFGVIILLVNGFVPAPTSDFLIIVQAMLLALSYLVVGGLGATYTGLVAGLLITAVKVAFFPYDLAFSLFFGMMVDALGAAFGAKEGTSARTARLVGATTVSTGLVGFMAYYVTAVVTNLVPNELSLDLAVLAFGIASGAVGGYLAALIWNRNLGARFQGRGRPAP